MPSLQCLKGARLQGWGILMWHWGKAVGRRWGCTLFLSLKNGRRWELGRRGLISLRTFSPPNKLAPCTMVIVETSLLVSKHGLRRPWDHCLLDIQSVGIAMSPSFILAITFLPSADMKSVIWRLFSSSGYRTTATGLSPIPAGRT